MLLAQTILPPCWQTTAAMRRVWPRPGSYRYSLKKPDQPAFLDTAAWVYYRTGDYDKAAEILEGVVEKAPKVPVFQYHLGMVYSKQGKKDAARKHLTLATDGDFNYQGIEEARATLNSL